MTAYSPQEWHDDDLSTSLSAARHLIIENGIASRIGSINGVNPDSQGNVVIGITTATQTALDAKQSTSARNVASGYCPLDSNANVPTANLYSASATQTGVLRLTGDLGGTSTAPTVPTKAPLVRIIGSGTALTGGGDLTADRVLAVNIGTTAGTAAAGDHNHGTTPAPVIQTYAASLTPNASAGNYRIVTATGDVTLNEPSSPQDGQLWRIRFIASGAQRIITFASALHRPSHIGSTLTIPSGRRGDVGLLYETGDGWTVLAAQAA
jgi:hypothetical protein